MFGLLRRLVVLGCVVFSTPSLMSPASANEAVWNALREPGTVALMRHARAPGIGDPPGFSLDDCATQRNLSEEGRADARAIGVEFRKHGVEVDRVLTSRWCRARETADLLGLAPVEVFLPLDSFFVDQKTSDAQTQAVRTLLAERARKEKLVLVTHYVNILTLTGINPASGEILVLSVGPDGQPVLRGRIPPER